LGVSTGPGGNFRLWVIVKAAGQQQIIARETEEGALLPLLPTR
jgi:hypothetical protein